MSLSRTVPRLAGRTLARPAAGPSVPAALRAAAARSYSSSSSSSSSGSSTGSGSGFRRSTPYAFGLLGLGSVGAYFGLDTAKEQQHPEATQEGMRKQGSLVDYQQVYNAVAHVLDNDEYDDGSYGPTLVRLAWHCSGTYDKHSGSGGSNGATMRFAPEADHGANAGLRVVRDLLDPIKREFPGLSYSDLWTLAGVCAVQEMGGPKVGWRSGRKDGLEENCTPDGRLPDGDKGADHIRKIFYKMGFGDQEIVALSGAHALGRCHPDRSGFSGPWTFSPISFTNEYYKLLMQEKWQLKKWDGPVQYEDKSTKSLMMLMTDMALTTDKGFRPWTERYAASEERFFADFAKAFSKLLELGVPEQNFAGKQQIFFKTTTEQQDEKKQQQ